MEIDTKTLSSPAKVELSGESRTAQVFEVADNRGWSAAISLLWSSRRRIRRFTVAGFIIGLLVALIIPPTYKSTTQLMPPDSGSGMSLLSSVLGSVASEGSASGGGGALESLGGMAGEMLGLKSTGDLLVGVLQSRTVQDRLIDRFDLRKVYYVKRYDAARKQLTKNTEILQNRKSGIITITVYDRNPKRAAAMAAEYVGELDRLMAQVSTSAARREREFLENRLSVVKQELDAASKDLSQYSSKNATLDVQDEGKAIVEAAATLQGQLIAAQSELMGLEQIYTPSNVRVKALQARVTELQRKLNEVGGAKGISTGEKDTGLSGQSSNEFLVPSLRQLPLLGVTYLDLYRRVKIAETVYAFLTQEYEMARVEEAKEIPSVKVLDQANLPERRSSPPRVALTILFTVFFFLTGIVWVLGERRWNESYSPLKFTLLDIARDIRATQSWRRGEELFLRMTSRLRAVRFFPSRGKVSLPEE